MTELPMNIAATISDLKAKMATVGTRQAELRLARQPHALAATQGDAAAKASIKRLDGEASQLEREVETLADALEHAERLQVDEARKAHADNWTRRMSEAAGISDELLDVSHKADELLIQLVAMLDRRRQLAQNLLHTGVARSDLIDRLRHKGQTERALHAAGMRDYVDLSPRALHSMSLFEQTEAIALMRIEMPPYVPPQTEEVA